MENINSRFAKRLRALRRKYKLTQEELAEAAEIDYKHLQDMEGRNPSAPTLTTLKTSQSIQDVSFETFGFLIIRRKS